MTLSKLYGFCCASVSLLRSLVLIKLSAHCKISGLKYWKVLLLSYLQFKYFYSILKYFFKELSQTFQCSKCCCSTFTGRVEFLDFVKWTQIFGDFLILWNLFLLNLEMKTDIKEWNFSSGLSLPYGHLKY